MQQPARLLIMISSILFSLALLRPTCAQAAIWQATQAWSPDVESSYQEWARTGWTKNVFDNPGPLQNVTLDCADAVYSMRLIFAFNNQLPFAVKDPSSNAVISNDMQRFDSISDPGLRFRAFAQYLYGILGTTSLPDDSYPVAMSKTAIHAGIFLKTDHATHHSWTVHDIDVHGIPYLIFSSRPAKTTLLTRHGYPSMGFLWGQEDANGNQIDANLQTPGDADSNVGFRMYRYPQDLLKPVWQVAGYSLDQYQMKKIDWATEMQKTLQVTAETPEELVVRMLTQTCQEVTDRISSVQDALTAMALHPAAYCFDADEYDDLSTPSRDSRSVAVFQSLVASYKTGQNGKLLTPSTRAKIEAILFNHDAGTFCPVQISAGTRLPLAEVVRTGLHERWSSNPNDSLLARWGEEPSTPHAQSCPVY